MLLFQAKWCTESNYIRPQLLCCCRRLALDSPAQDCYTFTLCFADSPRAILVGPRATSSAQLKSTAAAIGDVAAEIEWRD
jgi:hypothetical protein